jgi:hypothetical protein
LPGLPAGSRSTAGVLIGGAAIVLAAVLGYLYFKTQGVDFKRHSEVLALLRELKEIDARWDVELLRIRQEFAAADAVDYGPQVNRLRKALTAAANETGSPVLTRSMGELTGAFLQKADLIEKFRKANAATKQALTSVLAADAEVAGLVRGSWQAFRDRDRLVAAEGAVTQLLAEAQRYYYAPGDTQRNLAVRAAYGGLTFKPGDPSRIWIGGNATRVLQAVEVSDERVGTGSGEPDQVAQLANVPVLADLGHHRSDHGMVVDKIDG